MAAITHTISDTVILRVITAICATQDYATQARPGETQLAFAKRMIEVWIKKQVRDYESANAGDAAKVAAWNAVEAQVVIT